MRDQGYGTITESWTGTLVAAYLIWAVINGTNSKIDQGTFNGNLITGTLQSYDTSPCWPSTSSMFGYNIWVFAADVTSLVTKGANSLTGFPSGVTNGGNPWSASTYASSSSSGMPLDEGATLVVITTGPTPNQVYIYTGAYTQFGWGSLTSVFDHGAADATTAQTTFIVADGQNPDNYAEWNGVTIDSNAFPGSDPKATATAWSQGNLWDTKTYSVTVAIGSTSENAGIGVGEEYGDCITWAGQVLSIPSIVPITTTTTTTTTTTATTTTPSIPGVPEFGMPMLVVAISILGFVFLAKKKSRQLSKAP